MDSEEEEDEAQSEETVESGAPRNTTEEDRLAELTESIHILPPMAMMTEEQTMTGNTTDPQGDIHPQMGHRI